MKKSHVFVLAVLIAVGATFGSYALTRTTELGVQVRTASNKDVDAVVTTRTRQLNTLEISLRKALAKKPPPLPRLPKKVKALPVQSSPRVYTPAPVTSHIPARATVSRVAATKTSASRTSTRQAPAHESDNEQAASGGEHDD